jgi:threonine dehydratase
MEQSIQELPSIEDIELAAKRIDNYVHHTPILTCRTIDEMADAKIFFKCENFQKVGAFKFRGACNAVFSLCEEEAQRGVATHSSGNHASALALAANIRQIDAHVVMPSNTVSIKRKAVDGYGARIILCDPSLQSREHTLAGVLAQTNAIEIHPYNNPLVIAGQGTATLELLGEVPDLDMILAPVGGGGLLSGTAIAAAAMSPHSRIFGVEPKNANDAYCSFYSGRFVPSVNPQTIADGLLTSLGAMSFAIIQKYVHDIVTVEESEIISAMRIVWERMKIIIEPSSAVPVAVLLRNRNRIHTKGQRIGIILSGGNVDLACLPWL